MNRRVMEDWSPSQIGVHSTTVSAGSMRSRLRAVFLNGTLKRAPETSHTEGLLAISRHIFDGLGVRTDVVRAVDHTIPPGVHPDMREHGWPVDDFPAI